jgi:hypothetical protein
MARAATVGPVTLGYLRIDSSSRSSHRRWRCRAPRRGRSASIGQGSEGPGAAIAGRAVMATLERVATTRATTTSRVVANFCLMRSTFLQCAGP